VRLVERRTSRPVGGRPEEHNESLQTTGDPEARGARASLPTDLFGNILSPDELVAWFEIDVCLDPEERVIVKRELALLAEAEAVADRLHPKQV
jgi:hypothetical protein